MVAPIMIMVASVGRRILGGDPDEFLLGRNSLLHACNVDCNLAPFATPPSRDICAV